MGEASSVCLVDVLHICPLDDDDGDDDYDDDDDDVDGVGDGDANANGDSEYDDDCNDDVGKNLVSCTFTEPAQLTDQGSPRSRESTAHNFDQNLIISSSLYKIHCSKHHHLMIMVTIRNKKKPCV